jgi:hypothetical protein
MAINAVLAIIADGGRAIVVIDEGVEIHYFLLCLLILLKPFGGGLIQHLAKRLPGGCGIFIHQNQASGGENGSIMVGMLLCLCLASQKPSAGVFHSPARTDLGVKAVFNAN